jgi:hypothetical protein
MKARRIVYLFLLAVLLVVMAILLPTRGTLAQSDGGSDVPDTAYHLTTLAARQSDQPASRYTLTVIETRVLNGGRSGGEYRLASLVPADTHQYDYGICLPLMLKHDQ